MSYQIWFSNSKFYFVFFSCPSFMSGLFFFSFFFFKLNICIDKKFVLHDIFQCFEYYFKLCSSLFIGTKYFNIPFQGEFRDLRQFNNALLGKQVWQLRHETYILLHKVFKAKYFPTRSILDVEINPQSSYNWRSIMQAREVICKGARWRVRDGSTINIW